MKKEIKNLLVLLFTLIAIQLLPNLVQANPYPGYEYSYDESGDRVMRYRTMVYLKTGDTSESISALGSYDISIYPNPTKGLLTLRISNLKKNDKAHAYLSDFSGNKLLSLDYKNEENTIDLSKQPNGVYFLTIVIGEQTATFKIMKVD